MDGPSALGSQGVPYVLDGFKLSGQVDVQRLNTSDVLTGRWGKSVARPIAEKDLFPLDLNIVDFPAH